MKLKILLGWLVLTTFGTLKAQTTPCSQDRNCLGIERIVNLEEMFQFDDEEFKYGIKSYKGGASIKMFVKDYYSDVAPNNEQNSLLFGLKASKGKTEFSENKSWVITYNNPSNLLNELALNKLKKGPVKHNSDSYKQRVGARMNRLKDKLRNDDLFKNYYDTVFIELRLESGIKLSSIKGIELPGLSLSFNDFMDFQGDYHNLFNPLYEITTVSHRGYWENKHVVQNSLSAIDSANSIEGLDWIELDIRSTKDKHPILFHDDRPQKVLKGLSDKSKSVYDYNWDEIKNYSLYDRFNIESNEKLVDLEAAFEHIRSTGTHGIKKVINMDIGIPALVPQGGEGQKVAGQPFYDAVFLKAIGLALEKNILNQIVFKGKYTYDSPIWAKVDSVVADYGQSLNNGPLKVSKIAYTPKLGDDTPDLETYFSDWKKVVTGEMKVPVVSVVGFEIRLKNDPVNTGQASVLNTLQMHIADAHDLGLKVGVFSEAPSTCQGYWTKGAKEKYIDFNEEKRNSFEWLQSKGYDYIITDFPKNLIAFRQRVFQSADYASLSNSPSTPFFAKSQIQDGFTVGFKANPQSIKGKVLIELVDEYGVVHWKLGANDNGNIYVTRYVESVGGDFKWNYEFWEPEHTPYTSLSQNVYFSLVQEKGEMRLHIGTPNGKFDCMYADYGWDEYVLANSSMPSSLKFQYSSVLSSHSVGYKAHCRTDMFKDAIDHYFSTGNDINNFKLIDHKNPFLDVSDFDNDKATFDSDSSRLGGCTSYKDYFHSEVIEANNNEANNITLDDFVFTTEEKNVGKNVYPNPSSGIVNVQLESGFEEGVYELSLFDLQGQLMSYKSIKSRGGETIQWDFNSEGEQLPNGVYLLKITGMGRVFSQKLIIDCGCE